MTIFAIRPACEDDHPLIIDSFWRDFHKSVYGKSLKTAVLRKLIIDLLGHPDWKTIIAELPDVPGEIYGWMTYRSAREVAWVHVKVNYRKNGAARALLSHAGVQPGQVACAFLDPWFADMARTRGYRLLFRPFMTLESA